MEALTVLRHGVGCARSHFAKVSCRCVTFHGITDCRELVYCLPDVVLLNPGEASLCRFSQAEAGRNLPEPEGEASSGLRVEQGLHDQAVRLL